MDGQAPSSLPPIDRLPSDGAPRNVLRTFLEKRVRPWGAEAIDLPVAVTAALWVLLALDLALEGWLLAVLGGVLPCTGLVCTVATLSDHRLLTLALAGSCAGALVVVMPLTRGFSRAGGPQLAVVVFAGVCGVIALAGIVAVLVGATLCLAVALGVLFVVLDR
jgi:hypothetical protein